MISTEGFLFFSLTWFKTEVGYTSAYRKNRNKNNKQLSQIWLQNG